MIHRPCNRSYPFSASHSIFRPSNRGVALLLPAPARRHPWALVFHASRIELPLAATSMDSESDSCDLPWEEEDNSPYAAVSTVKMRDTNPAPKSNILLPLYIYPGPGAWAPLQQQ